MRRPHLKSVVLVGCLTLIGCLLITTFHENGSDNPSWTFEKSKSDQKSLPWTEYRPNDTAKKGRTFMPKQQSQVGGKRLQSVIATQPTVLEEEESATGEKQNAANNQVLVSAGYDSRNLEN